MDNALYDMIFKRKSFHLFRGVGSERIDERLLGEIRTKFFELTPLCPDIRVALRILSADCAGCKHDAEYCILLYSEKKDNYLQNIGYIGEQLDLFLVSKGIATLWYGIGRPEETAYDGLDYVIMLAIRKCDDPAKFRADMFKSKRKTAAEIWQGPELNGVTDIVRFAPSACNSQPWLVKNEGALSVYRYRMPGKRGIMPKNMVPYFNRIDIGIFLCFLELCLAHKGIRFERELFTDDGNDGELNLNGVYRVE